MPLRFGLAAASTAACSRTSPCWRMTTGLCSVIINVDDNYLASQFPSRPLQNFALLADDDGALLGDY